MAVTRLPAKRLRVLNEVLLELYHEPFGTQSMDALFDAISRLVPSTWMSADEIFPGTSRIDHKAGRNLEVFQHLPEMLAQFGPENPIVEHLQKSGFAPALKLSDFTTLRQFRNTGYYQELLTQIPGWRDQTAVITRLPTSLMGFAFHRERVFTAEDLFLFELLQPHLERVLHRSAQYASLPARPALTPREREVLHWLAEGKRDTEISVIVKAKPRTIEQHVRSILAKLGVETRTAAAAVAWRARVGQTMS